MRPEVREEPAHAGGRRHRGGRSTVRTPPAPVYRFCHVERATGGTFHMTKREEALRNGQAEVGVGAGVEPGWAVGAEAPPAGGGDHRRVVRAHRAAWQVGP